MYTLRFIRDREREQPDCKMSVWLERVMHPFSTKHLGLQLNHGSSPTRNSQRTHRVHRTVPCRHAYIHVDIHEQARW